MSNTHMMLILSYVGDFRGITHSKPETPLLPLRTEHVTWGEKTERVVSQHTCYPTAVKVEQMTSHRVSETCEVAMAVGSTSLPTGEPPGW